MSSPRLETSESKKQLLLTTLGSQELRRALQAQRLDAVFAKGENDTFWLKTGAGKKLFDTVSTPSIPSVQLNLLINGESILLENAVVGLEHFINSPPLQSKKIAAEKFIESLSEQAIAYLLRELYVPLEKNGYQIKNKTVIKITLEKNEYTDQDEYFIYLDSDITAVPDQEGLPKLNIGQVQWRLKLNPDIGLQLESVEFSTPTSELDTRFLKEFVLHETVMEEQLDGMITRPIVDDENTLTPEKLETSENIIFAGSKKKAPEEGAIDESKDSEDATAESAEMDEEAMEGLKNTRWIMKDPTSSWKQLFEDAKRDLLFNGQSFRLSEEHIEASQAVDGLDASLPAAKKTVAIDRIRLSALRSFIQRVFEKRKLFSSHTPDSQEGFDTLFENIAKFYCQGLETTATHALMFGVRTALDIPTEAGIMEAGLQVKQKTRQGNLFLGSDGKIYFEQFFEDIEISDARSRGWPNDKIEIKGQLYSYFILTSDGFRLHSVQSTNELITALYMGILKADPTLPLQKRIEQMQNFRELFSQLPHWAQTQLNQGTKPYVPLSIQTLETFIEHPAVTGQPPTLAAAPVEAAPAVEPPEVKSVVPQASPKPPKVKPAAPQASAELPKIELPAAGKQTVSESVASPPAQPSTSEPLASIEPPVQPVEAPVSEQVPPTKNIFMRNLNIFLPIGTILYSRY